MELTPLEVKALLGLAAIVVTIGGTIMSKLVWRGLMLRKHGVDPEDNGERGSMKLLKESKKVVDKIKSDTSSLKERDRERAEHLVKIRESNARQETHLENMNSSLQELVGLQKQSLEIQRKSNGGTDG